MFLLSLTGQDHRIHTWNNEGIVFSWEGHTGPVNDIAVGADGRFVVSASSDETLRVWSRRSRQPVGILTGHTDRVLRCLITSDQTRIVSMSADCTMKIWSGSALTELATLRGHTDQITDLAITIDSEKIVSCSRDKTVRVWDATTGRLLHQMTQGFDWVTAVAVSPDGKRASSASFDGIIQLWDLDSGAELGAAYGLSPFRCLTMTHDLICAGDEAGNLWILEYEPAGPRAFMLPVRLCIVHAPDDERLADQMLRHLDYAARGEIIAAAKSAESLSRSTEYDPDWGEADVILVMWTGREIDPAVLEDIMSRGRTGRVLLIPLTRSFRELSRPLAELQAIETGRGDPETLAAAARQVRDAALDRAYPRVPRPRQSPPSAPR
jgi:hypothetical protein